MCVHAQFLSHIHLFVTYEQQPARIPCPWGFSGKNTGVGCHFLLQEIFPTEGSNPHLLCLLLWQEDSLRLQQSPQAHDIIYILHQISSRKEVALKSGIKFVKMITNATVGLGHMFINLEIL